MDYTHNSDLTYYEKYPARANCGSFALQLKEWYSPDEALEDSEGDIYWWVLDKADEGWTEIDTSNLYLDIIMKQIMVDFANEIEICDGAPPYTKDKELIALRTFCIWNEDQSWSDYDFHFKVFRDGCWQQKNGTKPVEFCTLEDWQDYISDTIYFYHIIKGEGNECSK